MSKNITRTLFAGIASLVAVLLTTTLLSFTIKSDAPQGGVTPVTSFSIKKYLGNWYEIARLDFRWERNMSDCTAHYTLNKDGSVKVTNTGYNYKKGKWQETTGSVRFAGAQDVGALEICFFWPFYAAYNVVAIEGDYRYALVIGKSTDRCWIMSRTPSIPQAIRDKFVKKAQQLGVDTNALVWVTHDRHDKKK